MQSAGNRDTFDPLCRSTVIIGDIFEYASYIYDGVPRSYYDFIITDIFDEKTALFDGTSNSFSNANVNNGINTLAPLKSILKPNTGIVFFHLHCDNQYDTYAEAIKQTFKGNKFLHHYLIQSLIYLFVCLLKSLAMCSH